MPGSNLDKYYQHPTPLSAPITLDACINYIRGKFFFVDPTKSRPNGSPHQPLHQPTFSCSSYHLFASERSIMFTVNTIKRNSSGSRQSVAFVTTSGQIDLFVRRFISVPLVTVASWPRGAARRGEASTAPAIHRHSDDECHLKTISFTLFTQWNSGVAGKNDKGVHFLKNFSTTPRRNSSQNT